MNDDTTTRALAAIEAARCGVTRPAPARVRLSARMREMLADVAAGRVFAHGAMRHPRGGFAYAAPTFQALRSRGLITCQGIDAVLTDAGRTWLDAHGAGGAPTT